MCSMLDSTQRELGMLEQMQHMRQAGPQETAQRVEARPPAEPPLTVTNEMVQQMLSTGQGINRSNFQLVTRGYGPIGAPTMSLDQALAEEMANMATPSSDQPAGQEVDEDTDAVADAKTYKDRIHDEFKDWNRRGDGNKMGYG